jgi:hypothetical protein
MKEDIRVCVRNTYRKCTLPLTIGEKYTLQDYQYESCFVDAYYCFVINDKGIMRHYPRRYFRKV